MVLVSSINDDRSTNIAPISSCWWLGQYAVIGLSTRGQTFANIERNSQELVLNLASGDLAPHVDRLALTTAMNPVPEYKQAIGVEYVKALVSGQLSNNIRWLDKSILEFARS